jgi:hypothetical protein
MAHVGMAVPKSTKIRKYYRTPDLQLKQEAMGSIPSGFLVFLFQLAY